MEWDKEKCLQLIDLYRSKSEIWQPSHKFYHIKTKKQDAWIEIANDMESPVDIVKSKMNSLLSSFRRERVKEVNSIRAGKGQDELYRSKWFAYEAFQFLIDKNKCKKMLNAAQRKNNLHTENIKIEVAESRTDEDTEQDVMAQDAVSGDTEVDFLSINMKNTSQETNGYINSQAMSAQGSTFVLPKPKKFKLDFKSDPCTDQAFGFIQHSAGRDACEVYGEHIAMKLRTYSKQTQSMVQYLFNNILFNADMGQYDVNDPRNPLTITQPQYSFRNDGWSTPTTSAPGTEPPSPCSSGFVSPHAE